MATRRHERRPRRLVAERDQRRGRERRQSTTAPATATVTTLSEDELSSAAQRERRKRILDATLALASKGGYDAVQMRAVPNAPDVAVGTLVPVFPSKVHLWCPRCPRRIRAIEGKRKPLAGQSRRSAMHLLLQQITRMMQRDPLLTEAMTRAFMFADASAAAEVDRVGKVMDRVFAPRHERRRTGRASAGHRAGDQRCVAVPNLVAWLTRRASATDVTERLELTVDLLLGDRS